MHEDILLSHMHIFKFIFYDVERKLITLVLYFEAFLMLYTDS